MEIWKSQDVSDFNSSYSSLLPVVIETVSYSN